MIVFKKFEPDPSVRYGFSERPDGSMHRHLEKENRERYFKDQGVDPRRVVTADLVHGTSIHIAALSDCGKIVPDTDGLITREAGLFLSVTAADCFVLYFYDPTSKAVGILHAGWRGVLGGIVPELIRKMTESFNADPGDFVVGIGPGIRQCHFEIGPEDQRKYEAYPDFLLTKDSKIFVSLVGILERQLETAGVRSAHIEDCGLCTYCESERYFSYRRDHPREVQPMVGYIGLV